MKWKPHTQHPKPGQPILIARKDTDDDNHYHLENGLFYNNHDGRLIRENDSIDRTYWTEYQWCYETDVLNPLNEAPSHD